MGTPATRRIRLSPPVFSAEFREQLAALFAWRRDVRRFRTDPIPQDILDRALDMACAAPSVGNSRPWRFVSIADPDRRAEVRADFAACNEAAAADQPDARQSAYRELKLEGLDRAPVHLAVFADHAVTDGHGLGRHTMAETLDYSAILAVHGFWLAARAEGLGVGWVSIVHPERIRAILDVPESWTLIAYLCVGYAAEDHLDPELERHGWQARTDTCRHVLQR